MTRQQGERLANEMSKYRGEWILIKDAHVVAHAPTITEAKAQIAAADRSQVRAQFCPRQDFAGTTYTAI